MNALCSTRGRTIATRTIPLLALAGLAASGFAQGAPDAALLAPLVAAAPANTRVIEYKVIDTVLNAWVIDEGGSTAVRYTAIKGDGERVLGQLITGFETIDPTELNADEQLAYWLNLRALLVLQTTGKAFPAAKPDRLLQPGSAFFTTKQAKVSGIALSIADLDAIILQRGASDPNTVYGLALPVREAPAFPRQAYRGATVKAALDRAARAFVNRSGAIKTKADEVTVPQFLFAHRDRLGGDDQAVLAHLRSLAAPKLEQKLILTTRLSADSRLSLNAFAERSFADRNGNPGGFGGGGGGGRAAGS